MAEYILRDAAIEVALSCTDAFEPIAVDTTVKNVVSKLRNIPSADVQPVLRCKDCKEWHRNYLAIDGGKHGCELFQDFTRPDDFCSFGTRMDGET